jgi:hypothetical protein
VIDAAFLARFCKLDATLATVTDGPEVDESNHPIATTAERCVKTWVHPEQGDETTAGRQVATTRFVGYFLPCETIDARSTLTLGTATYEFDGPPNEWIHPRTGERVGWTANLVRTA